MLINNEFYIRSLRKEDQYKLKNWSSFDNPLLIGYDYSNLSDIELKYWYYSKKFPNRSKYFSILNKKDELIGFMGLKEISWLRSQALLGIVISPDYVNKKIGFRSLDFLLTYYFNKMGYKNLYLEVNKWNERAIHLYKKLGFKIVMETLQEFENQDLDLESSYYLENKDSFVISDGIIYSKIYLMKISREEYRKR